MRYHSVFSTTRNMHGYNTKSQSKDPSIGISCIIRDLRLVFEVKAWEQKHKKYGASIINRALKYSYCTVLYSPRGRCAALPPLQYSTVLYRTVLGTSIYIRPIHIFIIQAVYLSFAPRILWYIRAKMIDIYIYI